MAKRFIKLYEQITSWEWFRYPNTLCLFIYLLLKANYKDLDFHGRTIRRGQIVTSLPKISIDTGLSIQQTRTALTHLISTGEVTDESSCQYRIITIVKYDEYQSSTDKSTDDQQTINRRSNRQSTDDPTPCIEYIEQDRKYRTDRKIESPSERGRTAERFLPPTRDEVEIFCLENGLTIDVDRFMNYYTANGWMVGKNRMKDWRATVRNWALRDSRPQQQTSRPSRRILPAQDFEQRDYSDVQKELEDQLARDMEEFMRNER
jgi:hypothetical protein